MKRRLLNPILRRQTGCGKRCVTIPSSMNRAAQHQSIRALALNAAGICKNQVPFSRGRTRPSSIFASAEQTIPPKDSFVPPSSYFFYGAITAAFGTAVAFDSVLPTSRSSCDAPQNSNGSSVLSSASEADSIADEEIPLLATRPLWPGGVSDEDVDALVEIILEDPSINIQLIPDAVEAIVYKSAVKLTLNLFYKLLHELDDLPLLSHQIQVARLMEEEEEESDKEEKRSWFSSLFASEQKSSEIMKKKKKKYQRIVEAAAMKRSAVNDDLLDTVAARLLENHAVNNAYIPDIVEKNLYQSCLKVVFHTVQILSHTFRINFCGHDICLVIKPAALEKSLLTASSSVSTTRDGKPRPKSQWMASEIDLKLLEDFALKAGIDNDSYLNAEHLSWWDRFWLRRRRKMIAKLQSSLYALMLGIADDVSKQMNMSDCI